MPENALLWCWSLSSLSGKLPALRRDSRTPQLDCNQIQIGQEGQLQPHQQHSHQQKLFGEKTTTVRLGSVRTGLQTSRISELKGIYPQPQEATNITQGSIGYPISEKELAKESIYSRVTKPPRERHNDKDLNADKKSRRGVTNSSGEAVYESIITLDPFEMISMAHLNQLNQLGQMQVAPHLQHLQQNQQQSAGNVQTPQQTGGILQQGGGQITGFVHVNGNGGVHPGISLSGPPVHIVANPMGQDSLYTTIGDVSERVYECPDECPPPVPPKQMEVLYTKPTKVFPKSNGGAALKIYKSRENVPPSPTKDSSGSGTSSSETRDLQQENYSLKQEILAYRERMKALAMKLEQFDGISAIVEELQGKVDKVSQENARLRCFEREHREAQEQLKEAQRQYKLDVDQLSSQVALLDGERNDLECSLAKLQEEHDCLMISSQNSVSFQYHSQAMLEVKRLLEELKNKYQNDKEALLLRVEVVEQERMNIKASASQLEKEIASLRAEKDQLSQGYRKAVRQKQSLVQHIKDLQSEDGELHALMQSLLQSAHQAVSERDTLERLVKPTNSSTQAATHGDTKSSSSEHRKVCSGGQGLQSEQQPPGETTLPANTNNQSGEWMNNQGFLSC